MTDARMHARTPARPCSFACTLPFLVSHSHVFIAIAACDALSRRSAGGRSFASRSCGGCGGLAPSSCLCQLGLRRPLELGVVEPVGSGCLENLLKLLQLRLAI